MMHNATCWMPMSRCGKRRLFSLLGCVLLITLAGSCSPAREPRSTIPATLTAAAKVIDLSKLPLMPEAAESRQQNLATLSYDARGTIKNVFAFMQKQLVGQQWQEQPDSYIGDQSSNATFTRDDFTLSLSVTPASNPDFSSVTLLNLGNVDLRGLPLPPAATESFVGSAIAMYVTEASVTATAEVVRKLLMEKGWEPYGTAGDSQFFKQNAIRLTATVSAAPAQGGKTMISYSTVLMSADLPAPVDAIGLQYSDSTTQLMFDTKSTLAEVFDYYRAALAKTGWEATTENPIKTDANDFMIFRNPQHDLLTLKVYDVEGVNRVSLKFETAAQVAEMERRIKEKLKKEAKDKP